MNLNITNVTTTVPPQIVSHHFCKLILYEEIGDLKLRYWDGIIFIPNVIFLIFLLIHFKQAQLKLRQTTSPIFATFYLLVFINIISSIIRCIISMMVNASTVSGDITDKVFWVVVRFFLLSTEISVLVFGLAFGHLDSQTSIRRVLLVTSFVSLAYSICQGCLEIIAPDESFYINENYSLFSHGGMIFWFCTCLLFSIVYFCVFILPWTPCSQRIPLPTKRSFYVYALILSVLNLVQAVGSALFYSKLIEGLCIVDVTSYIYFTLFTPLVYWTFLSDFFGSSQSIIMFSYKPQVDEGADEIEAEPCSPSQLPHQLSCSSLKTDNDFIYQKNALYESTQFAVSGSSFSPSSFSDSITTNHSINQ